MMLTELSTKSTAGLLSTTCMILPVPTPSIKLSGVEEEKRYEPILTSNNHSTDPSFGFMYVGICWIP